jgi:ketosteroid isomerase-like protein
MEGKRRPEAVIRAAYKAFAERDVEALKQIADPEVEVATVTGMLAGHSDPYRGHSGLELYLADVATTWTRLELYPDSFHQLEEDRWLVLGRVRAWRAGASADSPNAWLWTIRNGLIVRAEVFADPSDARRLLATDE